MTIVELESSELPQDKPPWLTLSRRETLWGLAFISPWIVGFILLTAIPMIATLVFTFTNIRLGQDEPLRFVGLENYQEMFSDPKTWDALIVTFKYAAFSLPFFLLLPFALAMLLNSKSLRGS
ncbi:MAG TPA: ABC transporter permease, partial [Candidatus Limnocylindria bacterium]